MSGRAPTWVDAYIGRQIRARRLCAGLAQKDLGVALGLNWSMVQKYELGDTRMSAGVVWDIAAALGCRPGDLFPP